MRNNLLSGFYDVNAIAIFQIIFSKKEKLSIWN